ncbi:hypothetical protein PSTG_17129 [Puccinia striiformis f. sp. tritici PST-78]|uniref:Uncharacterized protein n=1 Tax=Puccinia striiformis f. sp. tritici PST-78 TaxID=1165861 RepID=A0A0L0URN3_9BASI|nr:hypothetical protein PSTG_17129 [Puccinia striiformis f. sp. tritici PST-78]
MYRSTSYYVPQVPFPNSSTLTRVYPIVPQQAAIQAPQLVCLPTAAASSNPVPTQQQTRETAHTYATGPLQSITRPTNVSRLLYVSWFNCKTTDAGSQSNSDEVAEDIDVDGEGEHGGNDGPNGGGDDEGKDKHDEDDEGTEHWINSKANQKSNQKAPQALPEESDLDSDWDKAWCIRHEELSSWEHL